MKVKELKNLLLICDDEACVTVSEESDNEKYPINKYALLYDVEGKTKTKPELTLIY